jgi:hypothetical protein
MKLENGGRESLDLPLFATGLVLSFVISLNRIGDKTKPSTIPIVEPPSHPIKLEIGRKLDIKPDE